MSAPSFEPIVLADYDLAWPTLFEEERARLEVAIGEWEVAIEHVGSTAIPGMAAKPVIDIAVTLRSFEDALHCITPLVELGYVCMGEFGIPGRIFFRKLTNEPLPGQTFGGVARSHQIHMYEAGHREYACHILFRDYLRENPAAARRYERLKRGLAEKHAGDVEAYAGAKSQFVKLVLGAARAGKRGPVDVVDYEAGWPSVYEDERARILRAAGRWVVAIEHVGSTSVRGLAAKPIIDIMAAVKSLDDAEQFVEPLCAIGYDYVPEYEALIPERRYFRRRHVERGARGFHLHVVLPDSAWWSRHLAFRDYLRTHPDAANEYAGLKRRLAGEFGNDHEGYTDAKSEFILGIEEKAAAAPGPSSPAAGRGTPAEQ